jgi:hypothetical protein
VILSGEQAFRVFSVINISVRTEPFDKLSILVERWSRPKKKPTIHTIVTA